MPRKLRVFRTPIGFHDAYVATPTKKAALEAWGTDANLFARGTAEEVTDPKLTAAPLERPGEVIRVSRGDLSAQLKALGPRKKPVAKGKACLTDPAGLTRIGQMYEAAVKLGVQGTPTFFVNGARVHAHDWAELDAEIRKAGG